MFRKYHYLNTNIHKGSKGYLGILNNVPVAFLAMLSFPHSRVKNFRRVHRLVVLPDYQGIGIGGRMMDFIGKKYLSDGYRYIITTSNPALIHSFNRKSFWKLTSQKINTGHKLTGFSNQGVGRLITSWEMITTKQEG